MLVVLEWKMVQGQTLPEPRIMDDSNCFDPHLVRTVRRWMDKEKAKFLALRRPTAQRISLNLAADPSMSVMPEFLYVKGYAPEGPLTQTFRLGTAEILLKKKGGPVLASFHYLTSQTSNNLMLCGPRLWVDQKGQL